MKKSDFKIDFSKRDVISMVCFTVVMIIVLVLGNSFGYVSADEGSSEIGWLTLEDYQSSANYDSDNLYVNFVSTSTEINRSNLSISYDFISSFDWGTVSNVPSGFNADNITHYLITGSSYPSTYDVYLWEGSEYTHCYYDGSSSSIVIILGNTNGRIYNASCTPYGTGWELSSVIMPDSISQLSPNFLGESGQTGSPQPTNFLRITLPSTSPCCLMTNSDLLTVQGSAVQGGVGWDFLDYYFGGTQNNIVNVNYLYGSALGLNGFNSLVGIGDGSFELAQNDSNNMYLENCKFSFNFNPYVNSITGDDMKYIGNYDKGNVTFSAFLNDYQLDNIDNFSLNFQFQVLIKGKGYLPFNNPNVDQLDDGHDFYGNFYCTDTKTLEQLYNGECYWNASELYDVMSDDTSLINGNNVQHLDGFLAQVSEYKKVDWSYFKIYATVYLVSTEEGVSSSYRQDSYNFLDGTSKNLNDSLDTNYNPFIDPDTGEVIGDSGHIEDSSSQTTSTGYGTVTQTNNNNQTVNVNTNIDSTGTTDRIEEILAGVDSDDTEASSWVDTFAELVGTNAFLSFMSSTFSFIPSSVWTSLATFFVTCLAFLTASVLLRMLLDLL